MCSNGLELRDSGDYTDLDSEPYVWWRSDHVPKHQCFMFVVEITNGKQSREFGVSREDGPYHTFNSLEAGGTNS